MPCSSVDKHSPSTLFPLGAGDSRVAASICTAFLQDLLISELCLCPSRCALAPLFWLSEKGRLKELTRATLDFTCHAPAHTVAKRLLGVLPAHQAGNTPGCSSKGSQVLDGQHKDSHAVG